MIEVMKDKDLFDSKAQTLVNTVNTVGVMGKGVALGFKQRFPEMYADYVKRCEAGLVKLGEPYLFRQAVPPWIINFPTKEHWRGAARIDAIIGGLQRLRACYRDWGVTSLAIPPLGCGEGGLDWKIVGPTLYRNLRLLDIPVELYAPWGTPDDQLTESFLSDPARAATAGTYSRNPVPAGWVALAEILRRINAEHYHYPVGHVTFQKLAYFATAVGITTGLSFARGSYGPFSTAAKELMPTMVNNGLVTETPVGGRMVRVDPGRTLRDARDRYAAELLQWDQQIARVADLLVRMNGREAEVAATVHFAAEELNNAGKRPEETDVLNSVMSWKARRNPPLRKDDVAQTIRRMNIAGWIEAKYSPKLPAVSAAET